MCNVCNAMCDLEMISGLKKKKKMNLFAIKDVSEKTGKSCRLNNGIL